MAALAEAVAINISCRYVRSVALLATRRYRVVVVGTSADDRYKGRLLATGGWPSTWVPWLVLARHGAAGSGLGR
jgi:hypothetical protein